MISFCFSSPEQVARATKGKADPNVAKELLVKALEVRRK
jgi:Asp-tRNA(Asn)/Glu-tRNA(Gln) amidotransferase B subunit